MDQFWNNWLALLLLAGPALLAWRLVPLVSHPAESALPARSVWLASLLACAGAAAIAMSLYWDPIGTRKAGRVFVYELADAGDKSYRIWEPTSAAFDTDTYGHDAAYTYKVLYDYLSQFYNVSRVQTRIDDQAITGCDVLIIKVPTKRLEVGEITAIRKFVSKGGGLLLVGEHTDVFGTGTYLNDVARGFGFTFRYDCLFDVDDVFQQKFRPDSVSHPIVQNLPELDYAVTCSIAPTLLSERVFDRAVIVSTGLHNLPADYHASNFYPQVEDRAETRYGSFVQLWASRHNQGRVVGFTDSTEFSNFCLFDPGKSELFLSMVEWLNHRSQQADPRFPLAGIGAMALLGACVLAQGRPRGMLVAACAGLLGWSLMIPAIGSMQKRALPLPKSIRPVTRVVMDRTVCDSNLPLAGFISGRSDGFGIFERWILRLGYFTGRRSGPAALKDDLLVFAYPRRPVSAEFRDALERYVDRGGKILVIDSAENQTSTANSLLAPFRMILKRDAVLNGDLAMTTPATQPATQPATTNPLAIAITNAIEVAAEESTGAIVLAKVTEKPVCTTVPHGSGSVTVVGFGSRFADANYGFTGDNEPDAAMRAAYQVQFDLLRKIVEGK